MPFLAFVVFPQNLCLRQTVVYISEQPTLCHHALFLPYVLGVPHTWTMQKECRLLNNQDVCKGWIDCTSVFTAHCNQLLRNKLMQKWYQLQHDITLFLHTLRHTHNSLRLTVHSLIPSLSQLLGAVHCKAVCNENTHTDQKEIRTLNSELLSS